MPTYIVEKIIGDKIENDITYYRIKWRKYPLSQSTWEIEENMREHCSDMVDSYKAKKLLNATKKRRLIKDSTNKDNITEDQSLDDTSLKHTKESEIGSIRKATLRAHTEAASIPNPSNRMEKIKSIKEMLRLLSNPSLDSVDDDFTLKNADLIKFDTRPLFVLHCNDNETNDSIIKLSTIEDAPKKYLRRILKMLI